MKSYPTHSQSLESRLQAAEEKAHRLFETSRDGILYLDGETGTILEANPAFSTLLCYTADELIGKKLWEICPKAEIPYQQAIFQKMQGVNFLQGTDLSLETGSGQAFQVEFTSHRFFEDHHTVILCNMQKLSDKTVGLEELNKTAQHYRTLTENMQDVVWVLDAETLFFTYMSPSVERLRGYTPQEICAEPMDAALMPEAAQYLKELIRQRCGDFLAHPDRPAVFYTEQVEQPCKNGTTVWTEVITTYKHNTHSGRMEILGVTRDISDRKQAEGILRGSEELYHSLFDNMQEGVALHRIISDEKGQPTDYVIEDINPSYEKQVGISADQARGKPASQVYHVSPAPYLDIFSQVAQTGHPYFFETYFPPLDRHFEISVISTGKNGFATIFLDVSARKRAEAAIFMKDELLRLTGMMAKVGGWEYDAITGQYTWTDETARIFDLEPNAQINENLIIGSYIGESRSKIARGRTEALTLGKSYDLELEIISTTGRHKYVRVLGNPITQAGKVSKIRGIIQDITDQVETQKARRESEQLYQQLFELAPIPLCSLDSDGVFTYFNQRFSLVFGYTQEDLKSIEDWWLRAYPDVSQRQEVKRNWEEAVQKAQAEASEIEPGEYTITCKDGTKKIVIIAGTVINNGLLVSIFDITESKKTAEALEYQRGELARSNAELEQFAYVTSHDLQEPLRMVSSYVQLLARRYKGRLDPDADEFIHYAVDGATRMQRLINDLLTYSRVGTQGHAFAPVACEKILEQVEINLRIAIQEANAVISHDPLPVLVADELQLGQLFQNLVGNALKFHGAEPARIHLSAEAHPGEWVFSVSDNGIGIDPQYNDRIFVIFQRLHTRSEYPGTGIGLAICKKIVERHGGKIWVQSQPQKGTTFFFTLPA